MGKIHILDEHIANQIAAGEVVERPASVVKELVENSIDAGSTKIDVAVEEGGLRLIRVTDNGSGIEADDCEAAFFRHATSKLAVGKDLYQIRSLGFRGEALPSIAAVAKVECITASNTQGLGRKVVIEGGKVTAFDQTSASRGTDILVKDLFYNTPARLKYMKTIQTEFGHISDYMYRLALAHPNIAFSLSHNDNILLQTLGNGDLLQNIAAIYGTSMAKGMLPVKAESLDYTLEGYITKPEITRANRTSMSFIVNGRYIRNYALAQAILQAYHTLLPIHRFPLTVIHIGMDPSLVDVNVHPAKLEVRFSKEAELVQFLQQALSRILGKQVLIPEASKPSPKHNVIQEQLQLYATAALSPAPSSTSTPISSMPPSTMAPVISPRAVNEAKSSFNPFRDNSSWRERDIPQKEQQRDLGLTPQQMMEIYPQAEETKALPAFPKLYPIGQMRGTYIIAQNEEGLYLIDQHAAHERINYEKYYDLFGNPQEASQDLLVPMTLEFTPSDAETVRGRLPLFEQAGVYLEHFGGNTLIVRSYPHWFPKGEEKHIIEEMAEWIIREKKAVDVGKLREKSAILCSCKASIKANQSLTLPEIEALLERLARCKIPYTCPHGRPIVVSFTNYELEKMFKRVM